jgi:hypothetical protein
MTSRITIRKCTTQYGGHNCNTQHYDTSHKHCMLSVVILNVMMLTVFLVSVMAPDCVAKACVRHRKGILQQQINFTVWQRSTLPKGWFTRAIFLGNIAEQCNFEARILPSATISRDRKIPIEIALLRNFTMILSR